MQMSHTCSPLRLLTNNKFETIKHHMREYLCFVTLWTIAHQAPLSMGFSRQEYWSGLPCLPPGDLPNPGIKPMSPALAGGFFTIEPPGNHPLADHPKC